MKQSNFFSLGWRDILRGLVVAILTPVFVIVQQSFEQGSLTFDWRAIGMAAIGGALAYLTKNLFTKPDVKATTDIGGNNTPPEKDEK